MATGYPAGAEQDPGPDGQEGMERLVEEIRLLVEMVVEHALPWLDELLAAGHGASHGGDQPQGEEGGDARAAACQWCPLCAVVAVARGQRPEFAVRLFEQAAQVVALLRAVLADRWEPAEGVHMPGYRPRTDEPAASARVQHITVRRRDDGGSGDGRAGSV